MKINRIRFWLGCFAVLYLLFVHLCVLCCALWSVIVWTILDNSFSYIWYVFFSLSGWLFWCFWYTFMLSLHSFGPSSVNLVRLMGFPCLNVKNLYQDIPNNWPTEKEKHPKKTRQVCHWFKQLSSCVFFAFDLFLVCLFVNLLRFYKCF